MIDWGGSGQTGSNVGMTTEGMDPDSDEFKEAALFDAIEGRRTVDPLRSASTAIVGCRRLS